jgi:hypothetical protein
MMTLALRSGVLDRMELTPTEQALVAALVSAIVRELTPKPESNGSPSCRAAPAR